MPAGALDLDEIARSEILKPRFVESLHGTESERAAIDSSTRESVAKYLGMPNDLSPEEREALARHLREHLAHHRYPFSPELRPLKSALSKLAPPEAAQPYPPVANKYSEPASRPKRRRP